MTPSFSSRAVLVPHERLDSPSPLPRPSSSLPPTQPPDAAWPFIYYRAPSTPWTHDSCAYFPAFCGTCTPVRPIEREVSLRFLCRRTPSPSSWGMLSSRLFVPSPIEPPPPPGPRRELDSAFSFSCPRRLFSASICSLQEKTVFCV